MVDKTPLLVGDSLTAAADTNVAKVAHKYISSDTADRIEFHLIIAFSSIHINRFLQIYKRGIIVVSNDGKLLSIERQLDFVAAVISFIGLVVTVFGRLCFRFRFRLITSLILIIVAFIAQIGSNAALAKALASGTVVYQGDIETLKICSIAIIARQLDFVAAVISFVGLAITVFGPLCFKFRFRFIAFLILIIAALIAQIGSNAVLSNVLASGTVVYQGDIETFIYLRLAMDSFLSCVLLYFMFCDGISVSESVEDEVEG